MALQMGEALARHVADFAGLDVMQRRLAGAELGDLVEPRRILEMDRRTLVPVGFVEFTSSGGIVGHRGLARRIDGMEAGELQAFPEMRSR